MLHDLARHHWNRDGTVTLSLIILRPARSHCLPPDSLVCSRACAFARTLNIAQVVFPATVKQSTNLFGYDLKGSNGSYDKHKR